MGNGRRAAAGDEDARRAEKVSAAQAFVPAICRRIWSTGRRWALRLPCAIGFATNLREQLCDALSDETVRRRGYFKPAGVQRLLNEHLSGQADHVYTLWALFMLELWMREFADAPVAVG